MTVFCKGARATYKNYEGKIWFVCEKYITFCIREFPEEKSRDVCMIIYPDKYDEIKLVEDT